MIVDGKKLADQLYEKTRLRVIELRRAPVLSIITCNPNFETLKYLALKQKKSESVGIKTEVFELDAFNTTEDFLLAVKEAVAISDAVIVQLPLPPHIDADKVLQSIPVSHDADALNPRTEHVLSPVVGACKEILRAHEIGVFDTLVTVIGSGRLVGLPAYRWFSENGAHVSVVTRDTTPISHYTKNADIIVCGAGVAGLITPDIIKEGVIILDAGTSEEGGELRGDALITCAPKSKVFTPVPGGIGPLTVAILLANVVDCAIQKTNMV